ncbi:MAG: FlgO family outer membrane protein [Campylobacterota bacterium]|nr:FlgO family outer membrane protein [Campylobacterota bacterium]
MRQIGILLLTAFIFQGCVKEYNNYYSNFQYTQPSDMTNYTHIVEPLLESLCPSLIDIKSKQNPVKAIYITDFVNLNKLENKSELGFILSDELKTLVTQKCDWPVHSIEYSKFFTIGKQGTNILSRDLDDLKNTTIDENTIALVGTYILTKKQFILYLKVINLKDGIILKSSTTRTVLTDEIRSFEQEPQKEPFDSEQIYQPMVL